ncbi:MAG: bifunctional 4-hydroxy-2-oxoglutarate aldolase/2-dehydro-3-deoxy-phosphogluconate aldolase [Propionibacteriaceae bacterium]|jgi:2-dehydro-3-deoxyphosphogluconate aldolase/(4S)-4-hydroxy-2-oxoglutarate aldolase|nr:bifunctional 4-hydroxy-2-oxoglutarate aldolase/2-dehydro-3-deoxy-phosphogluconate aldolase [Propionibacteriaceae bacterium]
MSSTPSTATNPIASGLIQPIANTEIGYQAAQSIHAHGIVAIIRGIEVTRVAATAQALAAGGVTAMEVTFDGFDAAAIDRTARAVNSIAATLGDQVAVGAGTVLTLPQLAAAREAGASFVVSPDTNPEIISEARSHGLAALPGAATATECLQAVRAGATFVKLFPAAALGSAYLTALRSPLPWLPIVVVGGVGADNVKEFLDAGAIGLGVGGRLVDKSLIAAEKYDLITERAAELVHIVDHARH